MMGRYKWLKEVCTTEYMSTVSAGVPMILLFLKRYTKKFEKKSDCSKTFGFFLNKLSLECRELTWSLTHLFEGGAYSTEYSVSKLSFKEKQR